MIYIDELLILNIAIDYLILLSVAKINKTNTNNKRIILSSVVGTISILYLFIPFNNVLLWIFKILVSTIMIIICYGYKDIKYFTDNFLCFYAVSFVLGGVLYYFKIQNTIIKYKYYLILIPFILNIYKYITYTLKNNINLKYKVDIYYNDKIFRFDGYMDTANTLIEPYNNKKVIIINKYIKANYFLVPYETINGSYSIKCFKPDRVYIDGIGDRKDIVIGIINKKFKGYDCLLNYNLMEEKC